MIKPTKLRAKLEDVMDMLTSDYTPAQWDAKNEVDVARYKEAKNVYEEAYAAISFCDIELVDDSYEDYYTIAYLMDKLSCELEMIEEDFSIDY